MKKSRGAAISWFVCTIGLTLGLAFNAGAIGIEDVVDGGNDYAWEKVEVPGTVCGNGSQYKFFVYDSPTSNDMVVMFEGGGACWDYASCSGQAGILGAANRNGISDDYITQQKAEFVSPVVNGADPGIAGVRSKTTLVTAGWDMVYVPYCTGDVHVGNNVQTYEDPSGVEPPIVWAHNGFNNTRAVSQYLANRFAAVNRLLVTGFSAGGIASSAAYYEVRRTIAPNKGYMLNDSGPAIPAPDPTSNSRPLHDEIVNVWDLNSVWPELPATFDTDDFGSINSMLAVEFPNDQLAYTAYLSDFNYSRYSYERFYPGIDDAGILQKWREDHDDLLAQLQQHGNYSWHVPWHRPINDSHCSTIITFVGSHSCPSVRKKRWYEVFEWPWSQSWKCPNGWVTMEGFLDQWIGNNQIIRTVEPENYYNNEDPGMSLIAGPINDAL